MTTADQLAIIRAYQRTESGLRERALAVVLAMWDELTGWRDGDAEAWLEQVLPVLLGAQQALGELTEAYLASLIGEMLGADSDRPEPAEAAGGAAVTGAALRGVPPAEVYARPFATVRAAIADGRSLAEAAGLGRERLRVTAATDMQLTATHTSRQVMARNPRVVGYRRVPGAGKNCALCLLASTQRYHKERLMPIHPQCSCKQVPIVGDRDPGQVLDEGLRDRIHQAVQQQTGRSDSGGRTPDYRQIVVEHEHGEIGAVMALRGQHFTGPDDLPR